MGILSDLFVATPEEAVTYEKAMLENRAAAEKRFSPAQYRNLLDLNFSMLWSIVAAESWDPHKHQLKTVVLEPPGETWLFRFPKPFVRLLSELEDDNVQLAAEKWAETEELQHWQARDTLPVIADLRCLARTAVSDNKSVFLWGSL